MAQLPFHAFWDREQGLVALWLRNELVAGRARPPLYRIYLRASGSQAAETFLGIFNSATPAVRWVRSPWILLPVGNLDAFELRLETEARRRQSGQFTLQFDANLKFDFERGSSPVERKVFLAYNEILKAEPDGSKLVSRRRVNVLDEALPGLRTLSEFVEAFRRAMERQNEEPKLMLAASTRGDRFGPVTKIWPTHASQIDISNDTIEVAYRSRDELMQGAEGDEDDNQAPIEMGSSVFHAMLTSAKYYWQPNITVHLGTSQEEAQRLQDAITFFHVKENVLTFDKLKSEGIGGAGSSRLQKLPDKSGDSSTDFSVAYRQEPHELIPATALRLKVANGGYTLTWQGKDIAMGDVVGLFVATDCALLLRGKDILASSSHRPASVAKCMYFRFLRDQLVPMLPEKLDSHYAKVSHDFTRHLENYISEARNDPSQQLRFAETRSDDLDDDAIATLPPQNLAELFYDAWDQERRELNPIRATLRRRVPRENVVQKIEFEQFRRWPNVMHALVRTPKYREVAERQEHAWLASEEGQGSFLLAALELIGANSKTLQWVQQMDSARQQSIVWDILAFDFEFINQCAAVNLRLPDLPQARVLDLEGSISLLRDTQKLLRSVRILQDLGERVEASQLESFGSVIDGRQNIELETLQEARRLIQRADASLQDDYDIASEIVETAKLHSKEVMDYATSDLDIERADEERKSKLRADIRRHIAARIPDQEARGLALELLEQIQTFAALRPLSASLAGTEGGEISRRLIWTVARGIVEWSSIPGLRGDKGAAAQGLPDINSREMSVWWNDWVLALSVWESPSVELEIDSVANPNSPADRFDIRGSLGPVADRLRQLLQRTSRRCQESVANSPKDLKDEAAKALLSLNRLAEVAFSTACARALTDAAADIEKFTNDFVQNELPSLRRNDRLEYDKAKKALDNIVVMWDRLGRCIAPERGAYKLKLALDLAQGLVTELKELHGVRQGNRSVPQFNLDLPPDLAALETSLVQAVA